MKPARRFVTLAAAAAVGAFAFTAGSSLVKDVQFAQAQEQVAQAREGLKSLADLSSAFKEVNHAMEKSVVHLQVVKSDRGTGRTPRMPFNPFFDRDEDGQPEEPMQGPREMATGSGVIMDAADGYAYIATNNHVVSDATDITVVLQDGRRITEASVVGTDPKSDMAVVKVKADRVITAKWGDSDKLEKGDIIVAFGSPFGFVGSMSHGIVSALNRNAGVINNSYAYENFIQVDAPINPGNSGGPLVNLSGEVVGINTAIASRTGSFAGIGFAIPSNQAKSVYDSLRSNGKVVRGYLGVAIGDITSPSPDVQNVVESLEFKGERGVLVSRIESDSPSYNVLKAGDIITQIDGRDVVNMSDLRNRVAMTAPGKEIKLTVWRDKKTETVAVKLGEQPDMPQLAANRGPAVPERTGGLGVAVVTPDADTLAKYNLAGDQKGALVTSVRPGSLAARGGIQPGDLITKFGDAPIATSEDLTNAVKAADLKKGAVLYVINDEGEKMVTLRSGN